MSMRRWIEKQLTTIRKDVLEIKHEIIFPSFQREELHAKRVAAEVINRLYREGVITPPAPCTECGK